jgi:hypothetical protein
MLSDMHGAKRGKRTNVVCAPGRWAHGYQTLEGSTEMYYLTSAFYTPSAVRGIRFDDRAFSIQWPLVATLVSEQARSLAARWAAGVAHDCEQGSGSHRHLSNAPAYLGPKESPRVRPQMPPEEFHYADSGARHSSHNFLWSRRSHLTRMAQRRRA